MEESSKTQNKKKRIGIIFGGRSGEHEVSLLSAASVIRAMNREKYDLVYIGITKKENGFSMKVLQRRLRMEAGNRLRSLWS